MDTKALDDFLERALQRLDVGDPGPDAQATLAIAAAILAAGSHVASGLAVIAQNIGEVRDELVNQRLS